MAVNEGDIVWAKHTDSRYHKAQVKCVQNRISYVFSDDGNPISEPTEINVTKFHIEYYCLKKLCKKNGA